MFQAIGYFVTLFATTIMTVVTAVIGSDTLPRALVTMADTERAFAKLGYDTNYRDAFIQYFADEAIDFNPEPGPALDRLRQQPRPPSDLRLVWEPRVGDIAMSGDLGYLTGPTETRRSDTVTRHGNYFSVWKKQADGRYKVILDVGASVPEKVLSTREEPVPPAARRAYFGARHGWIETPVLRRSDLATTRSGPMIVEEYDATCVIPPGARANLDAGGNIVMAL